MLRLYTTTTPAGSENLSKSTTRKMEWSMGKSVKKKEKKMGFQSQSFKNIWQVPKSFFVVILDVFVAHLYECTGRAIALPRTLAAAGEAGSAWTKC